MYECGPSSGGCGIVRGLYAIHKIAERTGGGRGGVRAISHVTEGAHCDAHRLVLVGEGHGWAVEGDGRGQRGDGGVGGRTERDEDVLGMRTDGSQHEHSRSLRQSTKAHASRRAIAFTCPSLAPFNLIASPTLAPHSAPALTHPVGLDVARDGLEGTRDIRIKRSTLPTQLYTYTHNRRATAADIQQPPIQYPAHNSTVRDNQRQGARKAGGARRAQAQRC